MEASLVGTIGVVEGEFAAREHSELEEERTPAERTVSATVSAAPSAAAPRYNGELASVPGTRPPPEKALIRPAATPASAATSEAR